MKGRTKFGKAVAYLIAKHEWKQTKLEEVTGLKQSSISELINHEKRPEPGTLQLLCTCWPDAMSNLHAIIEHAKDEFSRGGHDADAEVEMLPKSARPDALRSALAVIEMAARRDDAVENWIIGTAALMRKAMPSETVAESAPRLAAAEPDGNHYKARKRGKGEG